MKKLKFNTIWFCSNVGGGIFGEHQVAAWKEQGLDARLHYLTSVKDYWRSKSSWYAKLYLRWAMYVRYPIELFLKVYRATPNEIFVTVTNPFFVPALAAIAAGHSGAKVIYLVFDLYPDALIFGGGWARNGGVSRFAAFSTRYAITHCDATVYLGDRLRSYTESTYGKAARAAVIAVGTDATLFKGVAPCPKQGGMVSCLYSGHMGRLHDWRTFATALESGVPKNLKIEIAADGPGANALRRHLHQVSNERLSFSGTRQLAEWRAAMLAADVALVTMLPGAEKVVMPSKTYSAMAAGQAVLAVCPQDSDLADLVRLTDCGWIVSPGDAAALKSLLEELPKRADEISRKRFNAYSAAHAHYSMEATSRQWVNLFAELNER
jgi:glycosyltransferase involved in cell wall biosynthesis